MSTTVPAIHNPCCISGVSVVYHWCMAGTNIVLDDEACEAVMERFHLGSKLEAVNLALRRLASEPLEVEDARHLRGSGWDGDLDQMRSTPSE